MIVLRPACKKDVDAIIQLAASGGYGLTSLPSDKAVIKHKLERSLATFAHVDDAYHPGLYFFVLEDLAKNKIVGTSAIKASVGNQVPFYCYKVAKVTKVSHDLDVKTEFQTLHLVNDFTGQTEIGTLFLDQSYRKNANGVLLSRARFLFMAQFAKRFSEIIFAEMRGVSDEHGKAPFWNGLGKHFFNLSFAEADHLSSVTNKQFIADLMPTDTIYVPLLTKQAQKVIAKTHKDTKPALKMLEREGFRYANYIDIFDGGPMISAHLENIATVRESNIAIVGEPAEVEHGERCLLSNTQLDFRACQATVKVNFDGSITFDKATQQALNLAIGDPVRWVLLRLGAQ